MITGLIVPPGGGETASAPALQVTFKVTGARSRHTSVFETVVAPGFDVGAHTHQELEECFYILDGELDVFAFEPTERAGLDWTRWESADGQRPVRAGAGSFMFIPPGCPHAFRNPTGAPTRVLQTASPPPSHEQYLKAVAEILAANPDAPEQAITRLREAYDTQQLTPLRIMPVPG
ncbi:cupin domain-containing protein [Actinomadura oligospora]|uniref:cupin domain-containing protein n=1 Tax=Actinomadura oligospora TaxID=111804 RepID=UPI0004BB6088|nr:cupin domain-containing protein [Actinomadura oligospora]